MRSAVACRGKRERETTCHGCQQPKDFQANWAETRCRALVYIRLVRDRYEQHTVRDSTLPEVERLIWPKDPRAIANTQKQSSKLKLENPSHPKLKTKGLRERRK